MKDRKIYCLNNIAKIGTDGFRSGYSLIDSIDEAAGVLVRSADMKEMTFPAGLRAIARAGAGVNNIPLDRCAEEGIVVFNTPGANANSVKELVLCGMLLSARDVAGGIAWVRENAGDENIAKTTEKAKKAFAGHELMGKTLGVIGLGAIGVLVANAAVALGMKVYGFDPYLSVNSAWNLSPAVIHAEKIEEIYAASDFITIHVPAMASTKGMIGREAIAQLKPGAVVLNFARDSLVDEPALAEALEARAVDNRAAAAESDYLFLGVKPHMLPELLGEIAPALAQRSSRFVLVSMAAGTSTENQTTIYYYLLTPGLKDDPQEELHEARYFSPIALIVALPEFPVVLL